MSTLPVKKSTSVTATKGLYITKSSRKKKYDKN